MKIYELVDNPQNRDQYKNFLKQYKKFETLENKTDSIEYYLIANKYRLDVKWGIEKTSDAVIIEDTNVIGRMVVVPNNQEDLTEFIEKSISDDTISIVKEVVKPKRKYKKKKK